MKNNLLSKCTTLCDTPSNKKNTTRFNGLLTLFLMVLGMGVSWGQVSPQTFLTSGSWTCPTGVTSVQVECWGGGGAGGSGQGNTVKCHLGGGAGGAYVKASSINVTPGTVYSVLVGGGGIAQTVVNNFTTSVSGGDSWFSSTSTVLAKGGAGANGLVGSGTTELTTNGGSATTTGSIGDVVYAGGNGANGGTTYGGGGGGGSGGTVSAGNPGLNNTAGSAVTGGGAGGNGRVNSGAGNGTSSIVVGGGGGGAYASTSTSLRTGGNGGSGKVILTFTVTCSTPEIVISPSATNGSSLSLISWTNGACYDQMMMVASTSNFTSTLPSGDGTAYTANSASFTDTNNTAFDGGVVLYKGTGSSATVTSLTNGTTYNFKIYTRKGTSWVASTSFSATPALAQYFWDADANTTSGTGGTGTWDVSTTSNWRTPSSTGALTTWSTNTSPLDAVFEGTAGVVSLPSGTFTAPNFKFNTTGYTLATSSTTTTVLSGSINLGNNVGLTFSPNVNTTTTVSGTVSVGSISGSGTANITINSAQGSATNIAQRINIASASSSITVPINFVSAGGTGTGTVTGIVATATGTSLSSAATITNNTAIKTMIGATGGNDITVNGVISGSADLMFAAGASGGAGTVTLNAANSYTGATIFNAANSGVIKLGVNDALPTGTNVTFGYSSGNGGSLDLNGKNQTVASINNGGFGSSVNKIVNNGVTDATLTINGSTSPTAFVFGIQDGASNKILLVKAGSGTLILDGSTTTGGNTYTGLTTVTGGTLRLNKSGGTTIPITNNVTVDGGTLQVSTNQTLNNLTLTSGTVIIDAGVTLTITGTITRTSGVIKGTATSNLVITGASGTIAFDQTTPGTTNVLKNLTISGSGTTTLGNALNITAGSSSGTVTVGTGATLASAGYLTLKSDALGTASVGNSAGTISGNVTVERYIPAKRAWRALTAPLKGSDTSVFSQWQNNGIGTDTTIGVELWGPGGTGGGSTGNGLEVGPNNSILKYVSGAWNPVTNTKTMNLFTENANNAFFVFSTGGYRSGLISSASTPVASDTTLKATGQLITGQVDFLSLPSASHTLIGNPYASPISPYSILTGNPSFGSNLWIWDARAAGTYGVGAYNSYEKAANKYTNVTNTVEFGTTPDIQSGQAFFVIASSVPSTLTILEDFKSSAAANNIFLRNAAPAEVLRVGLYKQINNEWSGRDGAMTVFFADAEANQINNKMANGSENITFTKNGILFASEHHLPLVASDVLNVKVWNTSAGSNYKLKINTEQFTTTNLNATLEDLFTNSRTPLTLNGTAVEYPFAVTTEAASTGNRFRIVFETNALGINNPKASGISIVPNPITGDAFQVNLGTLSMGIYSYSICNALGQEVEKGSINNVAQNTGYSVKFKNSTAAGIYIMKVTGTDNTVLTAKIIKK